MLRCRPIDPIPAPPDNRGMGAWSTVAEKLFRRQSSPPAPFQVECVCGQRVLGERGPTFQTPLCPKCRRSIFVLPASVYPVPKGQRRKAAAPRRSAVAAATRSTSAGTDSAVASSGSDTAGIPVRERQAVVRPRRQAKAVVREAAVAGLGALDKIRRRHATPVRLVLMSVLAVVVLTGWWVFHVHARNEAEQILPVAAKLGEQALEEHDLPEAARQYQKVRLALDRLGRDDPQARTLRQTAEEIGAAANLAGGSLFDILHAAGTENSDSSWSETFRSSYRGGWVVVDAVVSRAEKSSSRRKFELDLPISEGPQRATVVAELPIFEHLLPSGGEPRRVIFAAQLDSCPRDPQDADSWDIVLRPKTAFLWSNAANLERLGVVPDPAMGKVLSEQAAHLGVLE